VIHYGGLGRGKGDFGFLKSLNQCLEFVDDLKAQTQLSRIHFYGHSWGGLVALNAAVRSGEKLGDLILVSPFSFVPGSDVVKQLLLSIKKSDSCFPQSLSIESAVADVDVIGKQNNPRLFVHKLQARRTLIVQSEKDDQVPAAMNRAFAPMFKPEARYLEVDQDHSFTNRAALIEIISKWVKQPC
jgi:pimeloyl-ACP methyl ester carboxylesterase